MLQARGRLGDAARHPQRRVSASRQQRRGGVVACCAARIGNPFCRWPLPRRSEKLVVADKGFELVPTSALGEDQNGPTRTFPLATSSILIVAVKWSYRWRRHSTPPEPRICRKNSRCRLCRLLLYRPYRELIRLWRAARATRWIDNASTQTTLSTIPPRGIFLKGMTASSDPPAAAPTEESGDVPAIAPWPFAS